MIYALVVMLTLLAEVMIAAVVAFVVGLKRNYWSWRDVAHITSAVTALSVIAGFLSLPFWTS